MSILNSIMNGFLGGFGVYLILRGFEFNLINLISGYVSFVPNMGFDFSLISASVSFGLFFGLFTFLVSR